MSPRVSRAAVAARPTVAVDKTAAVSAGRPMVRSPSWRHCQPGRMAATTMVTPQTTPAAVMPWRGTNTRLPTRFTPSTVRVLAMAWRLRPAIKIAEAAGPTGDATSMATARATSAPRASTTSGPKTRSSGVGNTAMRV